MVNGEGPLKIRKALLRSTFKNWGGDPGGGTSSGSEISAEYEVDLEAYPELTEVDLKRLLLDEKRRLDLFCLDTEYLRGGMTFERYKAERKAVVKRYKQAGVTVECMETAEDLAG